MMPVVSSPSQTICRREAGLKSIPAEKGQSLIWYDVKNIMTNHNESPEAEFQRAQRS
jgi:hypothetical protein